MLWATEPAGLLCCGPAGLLRVAIAHPSAAEAIEPMAQHTNMPYLHRRAPTGVKARPLASLPHCGAESILLRAVPVQQLLGRSGY